MKANTAATYTVYNHEFISQIHYNRTVECIGVWAQLTLGGTTYLPEKYVWKINKMHKFYTILVRKITKIPEFL